MEMSLYPQNLKGLDLDFNECIYAIVFGLEDEVQSRGKAEVFTELNLTPKEMSERVTYLLERFGSQYAYVLRRVLGNLNASDDDERISEGETLAEAFQDVLCWLRANAYVNHSTVYNRRKTLLGDRPLSSYATKQTGDRELSNTQKTLPLYEQVQRLMDEVRDYDKKRDQALQRIEVLMVEIKQREDCPTYFGRTETEKIDVDGSIMQICWPDRSVQILQDFDFSTIRQVVAYFSDFHNFMNGERLTLLEWSVITTILRKYGLLSKKEYSCSLNDKLACLELPAWPENCLSYRGIDDVDDLMILFAYGASDGWYELRKTRHFGEKSYNIVVDRLRRTDIEIDDTLCFLTPESSVRGLDFDRSDRYKLREYGIDTIGVLLEACQSENCFTGLRYFDHDLYENALIKLKKHGF